MWIQGDFNLAKSQFHNNYTLMYILQLKPIRADKNKECMAFQPISCWQGNELLKIHNSYVATYIRTSVHNHYCKFHYCVEVLKWAQILQATLNALIHAQVVCSNKFIIIESVLYIIIYPELEVVILDLISLSLKMKIINLMTKRLSQRFINWKKIIKDYRMKIKN